MRDINAFKRAVSKSSIWRALLALVGVQVFSLVLTFWGSCGIALGLNPESLQTLDSLVPLLALFCVAGWMGHVSSRQSRALVALANIVFWALMHLLISTRFSPELWSDGLTQLGISFVFWWGLALCVAISASQLSHRFQSRRFALALVPLALLLVSGAQLLTSRDGDAHFEADGTSWRLQQYDLSAVDFGLYDADSDDSHPNDNRNATWLSQAMPRVWSKIASQEGEPLCIVNGGFFGASDPLVGEHEAPLRANGRSLYEVNSLQSDWPDQYAALVWDDEKGTTRPQIVRDVPFENLARYKGALGGVRVLIEDGRSEVLKPGMGGTTLKCCRTSVAWKRGTNQFWVLSVRDPDGEASSVRDNKTEKQTGKRVQVGGWDVVQVQAFWKERGATDAVLFDGGESGQIAYRNAQGRWRWIHSSYHLSRTPTFGNNLPLRAVLPMLPPTLANGGVLNWFYIKRKTHGSAG